MELLVVISIIGVLATLILSALNDTREGARQAKIIAQEKSIYSANGTSLIANYEFNQYQVGDVLTSVSSTAGFGPDAVVTAGATVTEGVSGNALSFDGTSFMQVTSFTGAHAVSLFMYIPADMIGSGNYYLDARATGGLYNGWLYNTVGNGWDRVYINGKRKSSTYTGSFIPADEWFHLMLVSDSPFNNRVNFMSNYAGNGRMTGKVDNVRIYDIVPENL